MTIAITADCKNGKIYFRRDKLVGWRFCFFYVAIDVFYRSIDELFRVTFDRIDKLEKELSKNNA